MGWNIIRQPLIYFTIYYEYDQLYYMQTEQVLCVHTAETTGEEQALRPHLCVGANKFTKNIRSQPLNHF